MSDYCRYAPPVSAGACGRFMGNLAFLELCFLGLRDYGRRAV